jgi:protein-tyrosine-phosphatase
VGSAGTVALLQAMHPDIHAYLVQCGVDPCHHWQRLVSAELLRASDLVIAMRTDHPAFLFETFEYRAPLFNAVCHEKSALLLEI